MPQEFDRFLLLFDRLVGFCNEAIAQVPEDKLNWIPIQNDNVGYGDRVKDVTVKKVWSETMIGMPDMCAKDEFADGSVELTELRPPGEPLVSDLKTSHRTRAAP